MNKNLGVKDIALLKEDIKSRQARLDQIFKNRNSSIRHKVENAPACKHLALRCLELHQGLAHLEMKVKKEHLSWEGRLHGGFTATIVDTAIGAAAETLIDFKEEHISTVHLGVDYLSPGKLNEIICAKSWFTRGESLAVVQVKPGDKKLLHFECEVIAKPERRIVARGDAWFIIFGKKKKIKKRSKLYKKNKTAD